MLDVTIVFVEAESDENVGAVCRVMKNFGFKKLILVNPQCNPHSEKAFIVSKHARDVLENAEIVETLEEAIARFDLTVGTTGVAADKSSEVLRNPLTPWELAEKLWNYKGKVGIFFGRESTGFTNRELNLFDAQVTIPANPEYPILNISHAVGVIVYELFKYRRNPVRRKFKLISNHERFVLRKLMKESVEALDIQDYRKPNMIRAFENIIGKAMITKREFSILAGFFRTSAKQMRKARRKFSKKSHRSFYPNINL